MSLVTVRDRTDIRWTKFYPLYVKCSGSANTKNATCELKQCVSERNVQEYQNLDLNDDQRVECEQGKSKYINDAGVLEYFDKTVNITDPTLKYAALKELQLQQTHHNIAVSTEPLAFCEDSFDFDDTFVTIRILDKKQVWIEGPKICHLFGYAGPRRVIESYVSDENKRKLHQFIGSPGSCAGLEEVVKNDLSHDLIFINEAAILELSQHSRKPILKRFWSRICTVLSERYNMVFDARRDEILIVPKSSTQDEPMDVDVVTNSVQYMQLQLQFEKAKREKAELYVTVIEAQSKADVANARLREFQARYMFQMDCSEAIDNMHISTINKNKMLVEKNKKVTERLHGAYSVAQSITDVNPGKENVIAFIWDRSSSTYRAVRQIRESFDETFKFIQPSANDEIRHHKTGSTPKRRNEARQVIIGRVFTTTSGHTDWVRFKSENPNTAFGLEFVNHALMEFKILDEIQLRKKYEQYKDIDDQNISISSLDNVDGKIRTVMNHDLELYKRLNFCDVDECVNHCIVPDIWHVFTLLAKQMERDHLKEVQDNVDVEMRDCRTTLDAQTKECLEKNQQKYEKLQRYGCLPIETNRFARIETMSTMQSEENNESYEKCLQMARARVNDGSGNSRDDNDNFCIEPAQQAEPAASKINKFLDDLTQKRQTKPPKE